jgi:hypothetical protein
MQQRPNDPRMESMFGTDRLWAYGSVLALWLLYVFVFMAIKPLITDKNVLLALAISGGLVLLFNTASILAMISHYSKDKERIYGLDLHYLDIMNKKKV